MVEPSMPFRRHLRAVEVPLFATNTRACFSHVFRFLHRASDSSYVAKSLRPQRQSRGSLVLLSSPVHNQPSDCGHEIRLSSRSTCYQYDLFLLICPLYYRSFAADSCGTASSLMEGEGSSSVEETTSGLLTLSVNAPSVLKAFMARMMGDCVADMFAQ